MKYEWRVGEKVVFNGFYGEKIYEITRVTPAGLAVVNGLHFRKDGNQWGGGTYHYYSIRPAIDEDVKRIKEKDFVRMVLLKLGGTDKLTYSQAEKIYEVMREVGVWND